MLPPEDEGLLLALDASARAAHGVPAELVADRRQRAYDEVVERLGSQGTVRVSPLGPAWSSDIDVHVPVCPSAEVLRGWGWVCADPLLRRLRVAGSGRWVVRSADDVLGLADLQQTPAPDAVATVLARARRRREVRLREVLELRTLMRCGARLPSDRVVTAAADLEHACGGDLLTRWRSGGAVPRERPVPLAAPTARLRRLAGSVRPRPRVVVALSGVDGAGKSTLASGLLADLAAVNLPTARVWARPGMGLGWLSRLAERVKSATGQSTEPGVRAVAAGDRPLPSSRRGVVGLLWTTAVTLSFVVAVRRQHRAGHGVIVYDRHLLDALATLHVLYRGVPLALPTAAVRRLLPRADLTVYLRLPADVAHARKPDDPIGAYAVAAQVAEYERLLPLARGLLVLDATLPPAELRITALERLLRL